MTKRLIWNFSLDTRNALNFQTISPDTKDEINWEARYFWPESSLITLQACPISLLGLHDGQLKYKTDSYYLIPDFALNLKKRRGELLYKPLVKRIEHLCGYSKKIILIDQARSLLLPGEPPILAEELWEKINQESQEITVYKTSLVIPFPTVPKAKLELSRISVNHQTFYSVSLEAYSQALIDFLSRSLLPDAVSCDYVTFLQQFIRT